jgi:hypothetical protein
MPSMTFKNDGTDFSAYHAAEKWLRENGYSYGSMQAGAPTGIVKGDCAISKWRNIRQSEMHLLDGQIEAGDPRNGDVVVTFKEQ